VDNSVKYNVGRNAHSISDHTQTNWNGIIGRIELRAEEKMRVDDVQVYGDVKSRAVRVKVLILNDAGSAINGTLTLKAACRHLQRKHSPEPKTLRVQEAGEKAVVECVYELGEEALLWDEFAPVVYELSVSLKSKANERDISSVYKTTFGLRDFSTDGTQFTINGRPTFLRGTLECCIFPLTGYPPTDAKEWLRILGVAKSHGLNHLRFHSWCPPEAAFEAADQLGIYFHVETPCWTTIGDGHPIDKYVYAEGDRILKAYGNHPSFCMLAYGNEPGGKNQRRFLGDLVNYLKKKDPRRLYTSAAGWPIIPESQYHSTPAPRGHQWGAGLKSRFNAKAPETASDYREFIQQYDVPVVSHEIGQWCVFPNMNEIGKYKGTLRAGNFEIVRDSLAERGMLDQAHDFLMASGKLQALLYKEEIESALRTPSFGGFQLLDLHDFPGQGTALIGVLDAFWDSKGYVAAAEHRRYCCETVPLVRMQKRIWTNSEMFDADVEVAHFGPVPLEDATARWSIRYEDGRVVRRGELAPRTIPVGNGFSLGSIRIPLSSVTNAARLILTVSLKDTWYNNNWDIWVYPTNTAVRGQRDVLVADSLSEEALAKLNAGGKVLLMPSPLSVDSDVPAGFTSIFWNTAWTNKQPPHTLGILCDPRHPALENFPTDYHSNWQWWDLVRNSKAMILDDFSKDFRPIVQVIDDWNTNRKLGLLFEAKVGPGKLLVCSVDLKSDMENRPVARQMYESLLAYMDGAKFSPSTEIAIETVRGLFREPPLLGRVKRIRADSEAVGHEAANAIDGNPSTIWHTAWEPAPQDYPHELVIELKREMTISGLRYLPRQDMSNGWVSEFAVYVSSDATNWAEPVAKGRLQRGRAAQEIVFEKPVKVEFIRFVAAKGIDGQKFASVAELELVEAVNR
jgi:hypothetical protein